MERLDVTTEELEALLEGVREPLGEADTRSCKAAIRTLGYVTELLENREATLATVAPAVVPLEHGEDGAGAEAGRHRSQARRSTSRRDRTPRRVRPRAWAQRRRGVSRGAQGRGSACVVTAGGPLPGVSARQSLSAARSGPAGADPRPGADRRHGVRIGEAALQLCAGSVHRRGSGRSGDEEVR